MCRTTKNDAKMSLSYCCKVVCFQNYITYNILLLSLVLQNQTLTTYFSSRRLSARLVISLAEGP